MNVDSYYVRALLERAEAALEQACLALRQAMGQLDDDGSDERGDEAAEQVDTGSMSDLTSCLQAVVNAARTG